MAKLTQFKFTVKEDGKPDEIHEVDCVKLDADDSISIAVREAVETLRSSVKESLELLREPMQSAERFSVMEGATDLGIDKMLKEFLSVSQQKEAYKVMNGFKEAKAARIGKNTIQM